ncbi:hypothetical protein SH611_02715 [Geminicoccaceae bacterium 1502E]|nr:hypothetical protein [Geminicoccaceae bacterium 1502E]
MEDDGALVVDGRRIRLHGILIPLIERTCRRALPPVRCGWKPVLVLDSMVEGFVHCTPVARLRDGTMSAVCTVEGERIGEPREDLAARMLLEGWALAGEDAPGAYRALERLAESREAGLWSSAIIELR